MLKRLLKSSYKYLPFGLLSIVLCLLLSFSYKPFFKENISRINFKDYKIVIKNHNLKINFPENYVRKVINTNSDQKETICEFIKSLKPVLSDDFSKTLSLNMPTSWDADGIILFDNSYLFRLFNTNRRYNSKETVLVIKYKIVENELNFKESVYYTSSYNIAEFFEWINTIDNEIINYPFS